LSQLLVQGIKLLLVGLCSLFAALLLLLQLILQNGSLQSTHQTRGLCFL
jgi:hypothetical protein